MELTKEEMKKLIKWLEEYDDIIYLHRTPEDLDGLLEIVDKFKTYLDPIKNETHQRNSQRQTSN